MNILITNIWLNGFGGTESYVRDLAVELLKYNYNVEIYTNETGEVANTIAEYGINVTKDVNDLKNKPDLIHAHHYITTMEVISRFPGVPIIYFMHDRTHPVDFPPKYSRIVKYCAVDYNCLDRLIVDNGITKDKTEVIYNWVDTDRFKLKDSFNDKPLRALVFSNYATTNNYYKEIKLACDELGIHLDGIGLGLNNPQNNPQNFLSNYDIVFGKAKAALEAMATGAAVVLCDFMGMGELITIENYNYCRRYNFGMKTLTREITKENIIKEVQKYNSTEAKKVSIKIHKEASLQSTVAKIVSLYKSTIEEEKQKVKDLTTLDIKLINDFNSIKRWLVTTYSSNSINSGREILDKKNHENKLLKEENSGLKIEIANLNEKLQLKENLINQIADSVSFKLGRLLTIIPRSIKRISFRKLRK